ncbi:MAG: inosine/xanthosine triphosphatase [Candidatus Hodarchaeales archaeon]|jgi:inosine/xanthosine triphosphatase
MVVKVLIASTNPVKISATRESFSHFYKDVNFSILNVNELDPKGIHLKLQPLGEDETYEASIWRVKYARNHNPGFDFYVGIEGGVDLTPHNQARIVVYSSIGNRIIIETVRGCEIPLPYSWYKRLKDSPQLELGDIASEISGVSNIKQKQGAVGFFTRNTVTRFDILKQSVLMALIPFLNPIIFEMAAK